VRRQGVVVVESEVFCEVCVVADIFHDFNASIEGICIRNDI
jgi:hypothetical protein